MSKTKLLRVTQMDAVHLNDELEKVLLNQVQDCLQYLPPAYAVNYQKEIHLTIKLLLLYMSLFNHNCTFGQKLLLVKYVNISQFKKYLYLILSSLNYVKDKSDDLRRSSILYKVITNASSFIGVLSFINLCLFIRSGKYPLLVDRILGINQEFARDFVQRQFGSKYLTRELLWNGFIEVLMYILPIVNYHKMKRVVRDFLPFHKKTLQTGIFERQFTVLTKCGSCGEIPVLPYHMGCSHIFCYICLKGNLTADQHYECPLCGHRNTGEACERVTM